jgi:histone deacetylase complex regulatory component SIN3
VCGVVGCSKGKSRNRSRSNEVTSIPGKKRLVSRSVVDEAKAGVKREKEGGAKREGAVKEHVPAALEFESTQQYLELVRTRLKNRDAYQDFLKLLHLFGQDIITMGEMKELVLDILSRYPDLLAGFDEFLKHGVAEMDGIDIPAGKITVRDAQKARQQAASQLSKFMTRSIAELDLSNCEKCTPSYRLLPRNYPHLKVTHRNAIGREVFNDKWVGVTSGSEDYSFKHMRKNQYEENLFRAEVYDLPPPASLPPSLPAVLSLSHCEEDYKLGKLYLLHRICEFAASA